MNTPTEKSEAEVIRAYALLGNCAVQFSALEFHIQFLLSYLHIGRELAVETVIFTRRLNFSRKLALISELLRLRLHDQPQLLQDGLSLTTDLEALRQRRNLFIHGYWLVNHFLIMDGILRVSDTTWEYNKKNATYTAMESIDVPLIELKQLPEKIRELIDRSHKLLKQIKELHPKSTPIT